MRVLLVAMGDEECLMVFEPEFCKNAVACSAHLLGSRRIRCAERQGEVVDGLFNAVGLVGSSAHLAGNLFRIGPNESTRVGPSNPISIFREVLRQPAEAASGGGFPDHRLYSESF